MLHPIKVLLVDDEQRFLETTAKILEYRGMLPLVATGGEEALEMLGQSPDVVVLDCRMTGMSGEETLACIKSSYPAIPVIMLTGHGEQASAEQALVKGAFDYLTKPADVELLVCKINEAFRFGGVAKKEREKTVGDLMTPIEKCFRFGPETSLGKVIEKWVEDTSPCGTTATGGFSNRKYTLVFRGTEILGIVSMWEILDILRPPYLADGELRSEFAGSTCRYSKIFWNGMFDQRLCEIVEIPIRGVMTLSPPLIGRKASLLEVCDLMKESSSRSLLVMDGARVVGIVGEQEMCAEMLHLYNRRKVATREEERA
jgi:CheY-like chemotaxis protein